jgi:predicted RNA binding protein YcfA (HicA-like mRNA interferase family)
MSGGAREATKLVREILRRPGWELAPSKNNHYKLKYSGGGMVVLAASPSDVRAIHNTMSLVRSTEKKYGGV